MATVITVITSILPNESQQQQRKYGAVLLVSDSDSSGSDSVQSDESETVT